MVLNLYSDKETVITWFKYLIYLLLKMHMLKCYFIVKTWLKKGFIFKATYAIQEKKREGKPPPSFNEQFFGPLSTVLLFFPLTKHWSAKWCLAAGQPHVML